MLYILALAAILLGLVMNKSNIVFAVMMVLIWLMLGWGAGNADYAIHLGRFNYYESSAVYTEVVYTLLMQWANNAGLTYQQFLPLVMLVYVVIIGFIVKKVSKAPAFVLALYLIFPACMEAVQVRYTLASAFVLLGFYFLFKEEDWRGELMFVALVVLSAFMHVSTIVFIPFMLVKRLNMQRVILCMTTISAIISLSQVSFVIDLIGRLPGMAEKIGRVLASASNRYTYINVLKTTYRCLVFFVLFMFLSYLLKRWVKKYQLKIDISYIDVMQKINVISLIIIPLLFYSVDFYRIQQTLSLLNYCALSYYVVVYPHVSNLTQGRLVFSKRREKYVFVCVLMAILNLYYLVLNSSNFLTVFKPFFENNLFFGGGYVRIKEKSKTRFQSLRLNFYTSTACATCEGRG